MPAVDYSEDVWAYLDDVPKLPTRLPTRQDRDALVQDAQKFPRTAKRVRIWDYFFRVPPKAIGRKQRREITELQQRRDTEVPNKHQQELQDLNLEMDQREQSAENQIRSLHEREMVVYIVGGLAVLVGVSGVIIDYDLPRAAWVLVAVLGLSAILIIVLGAAETRQMLEQRLPQLKDERAQRKLNIEADFKRRMAYIDGEVKKLEAHLDCLDTQIPNPPSDSQIARWLKEDIDEVTELAKKRADLSIPDMLVTPRGRNPNPLLILGPAKFRASDDIPPSFREQNSDLNLHLNAQRTVFMLDQSFEVYYGVYALEFILLAQDVMVIFDCYLDFITGKISWEKTYEQYFTDIVAVDTRRYESVLELGGKSALVKDVLTFHIALSNGGTREITFAGRDYFEGSKIQLGIQQSDIPNWLAESQEAAENAVRIVRAQLQDHKKP